VERNKTIAVTMAFGKPLMNLASEVVSLWLNAFVKSIVMPVIISYSLSSFCIILFKKGNLSALLPIGIFLVLFLGIGIITQDFYKMPAIVAFLIALIVAMMQNKKMSFDKKIEVISKSVGDENVITMCLIFLAAGAFSGAVSASGGAESVVNFGLSIIPSNLSVIGLFVIGCFISVSMGTSMGTIATLAPIAMGISKNTGFDLAICMALVSSLKDTPIAENAIAFGEIGLAGEIRSVNQCQQRINEAVRLGFTRIIIPNHNLKGIDTQGAEVIGVKNIRQAFEVLCE
jgi:hypothetical protein